MMTALTVLYGKRELDQELLRIWYGKLKRFDIDMVSRAFDKWVDSNKYMPLPVDIIDLCKAQENRIVTHKLPKPSLTPEQVQDNLHKLDVVKAAIKKPKDQKKWAKDILELVEKGIYTNELGIKYAKEVLNVTA